MKEIAGNLWDHWNQPGRIVCITTNGFVKKDGHAVMGRGVALQATGKVHDLKWIVGMLITRNGNIVQLVPGTKLLLFPTKYHWAEKSDPGLIETSAKQLEKLARAHPEVTYILPRPGTGNGQLSWDVVKPKLVSLPDNVWVISYKENR